MAQFIEVEDQVEMPSGDENESRVENETKESSVSDQLSGSEKSQNSTKSLSGSSIEQYLENGRRYCSETYYMPNDDAEHTRLAILHQAFLSILDSQLTFVHMPRDLTRILDIGTGTGEWAVAMGERFPDAEIIATDIDVCQPTDVPQNVYFEVDDAQEEWTYTEPFDLIHIRGLTGAFRDWAAIYASVCKHLRLGGYFEIADFGSISLENSDSGPYVSIFDGACQSAAEKVGRPIGLGHLKRSLIEGAGLSVVKSKIFDVPLGTWSSDSRKSVAGKMAMISALEGLEASSLRPLTREMGWKEEDVKDLCGKVKGEVMKPENRASIPCQIIVARKMME